MRRQEEDRLIVPKDALQLFHFLEEGVEFRILAMGLVADDHGLGVFLPTKAIITNA